MILPPLDYIQMAAMSEPGEENVGLHEPRNTRNYQHRAEYVVTGLAGRENFFHQNKQTQHCYLYQIHHPAHKIPDGRSSGNRRIRGRHDTAVVSLVQP
jgi:hypothetical protein